MGKNYRKRQDISKSSPRGDYGVGVEEVDLCEFGIVHEECIFCGQPRTVKFDEHYNFCPNCKAVYTIMIVQESGCDHVVDGTPVAVHEPCNEGRETSQFIRLKNDVFIRLLELSRINPGEPDQYFCSVCSKKCLVDGW